MAEKRLPGYTCSKGKEKKTVSIKSINNATTWRLENEADVKSTLQNEKKTDEYIGRRYDYQH